MTKHLSLIAIFILGISLGVLPSCSSDQKVELPKVLFAVSNGFLYGITGGGGLEIFEVNTGTGAIDPIGTASGSSVALARDPDTNLLYYIIAGAGGGFFRFNTATGTNTEISPGPLGGDADNNYLFQTLAFNADGKLYAIGIHLVELEFHLFRINKNTGEATFLHEIEGPNSAGGDIAFAPNAKLYGVFGQGFFQIDLETGDTDLIGQLFDPTSSSTGLGFDRDGNAFLSDNEDPSNLYSVDLASGEATLIANNDSLVINDLVSDLPDPDDDTDGGGLSNEDEVALGKDPTDPSDDDCTRDTKDSDGDGVTDCEEITANLDPFDASDVGIQGSGSHIVPGCGRISLQRNIPLTGVLLTLFGAAIALLTARRKLGQVSVHGDRP